MLVLAYMYVGVTRAQIGPTSIVKGSLGSKAVWYACIGEGAGSFVHFLYCRNKVRKQYIGFLCLIIAWLPFLFISSNTSEAEGYIFYSRIHK